MTAANPIPFWQLPPLPQPPHDPRWWLLDGRAGWRAQDLDQTSETRCGECVSLDFLPATGRILGEPTGSFGGLVPPANVAISPEGHIYLLDRRDGSLKVFDPCCCRFETLGCLGGSRLDGKKLSNPGGIAFDNLKLYLTDTGNARLLVFQVHGLRLAAVWSPPSSANLPHEWQPRGVAIDGHGRVFIADPGNGLVHRFRCTGRYDGSISGTGAAEWISIDRSNRLYAAVSGQSGAAVFDCEGQPSEIISRPEDASGRFRTLPFRTNARGELLAGPACVPPTDSVFDPHGSLLPDSLASLSADPPAQFFPVGSYLSQPLDSKLYRCQWHRVVLNGKIPLGTSVTVCTYTNEVRLAADEVAVLGSEAWQTNLTAAGPVDGEWDCLVLSGGGRFLWLRLELTGSGSTSPVLESVKIEFPRISLSRYLPAVFGEDPTASNFTDRFLGLFDTPFREIERQIDDQASLFDPLSAPAVPDRKSGVDFLSWLASWIGVNLNRQTPIEQRRRLLDEAGKGFPIRGTRYGLWQKLLSFLGMTLSECCCRNDRPQSRCVLPPANCRKESKSPCAWVPPPLILEHYQLRRWLVLGSARLSDQAVLWGKRIVNRTQLGRNGQVGVTKLLTTPDPDQDPFLTYAHKFSVFVPAACGRSDPQKRAIVDLLDTEKPAHTLYQLEFVEPRFRIGFQSMIGLDSVVGGYPSRFALGQMRLGRASVLGGPEGASASSVSVGQSRIGSSMRLD